MKKSGAIAAIIAVALLAGGWIYYSQRSSTPIQPIIREEGTLIRVTIYDDPGNPKLFAPEISEGSTVFSALQSALAGTDIPLEYKSYGDMGVLITKIAGLEGGADGKYWQYYVNGEYGKIAADKKEVKAGDKVEWKFLGPNEQ